MFIISGRNNNYPCIPELAELNGISGFYSPYPLNMIRVISTRNGGYPCVMNLIEQNGFPGFYMPYPEYMLRCLGEGVNNGYPSVMQLSGAAMHTESELYFREKMVCGMYYNDKFISSAFCNDENVFRVYYA